MKAGGM